MSLSKGLSRLVGGLFSGSSQASDAVTTPTQKVSEVNPLDGASLVHTQSGSVYYLNAALALANNGKFIQDAAILNMPDKTGALVKRISGTLFESGGTEEVKDILTSAIRAIEYTDGRPKQIFVLPADISGPKEPGPA